MSFGITQTLSLDICENAEDAVRKGYKYKSPEYKPINISKVVVVKNGTEGGNSTVDLILEDASGQKFVTMITGKLLSAIPV